MTLTETDLLPQSTHIGRTALKVSDRQEMSDFYRRIVGLNVLYRLPGRTALGVDDTPLLVLEEQADERQQSAPTTGLFHTAFRVPSRRALGDALARIRNHWQLDGATNHRVSEALYVTDPEGNGVEIYQDFPEEEWPVTDDGRILLGNDPLDLNEIETGSNDTQAPPETDIGHLHLEVSSLESFRNLFVDTLGFEVKSELENFLFISSGNYHHHIAANTNHNKTTSRGSRRLSWFEVVLPEIGALASLRTRLADSQYTVNETKAGFSVRSTDDIEIRFR